MGPDRRADCPALQRERQDGHRDPLHNRAVIPQAHLRAVRGGGLTGSWKHFGVLDYRRFETGISAGLLSQADSVLLALPRRQPVMRMTNVNVHVDGVPIVVTGDRMDPQHMEVVVRFSERTGEAPRPALVSPKVRLPTHPKPPAPV
ncbi:transcriptional regulator GntR family [Bradyrhizobium elkanii USDA 61]|nr:transcriptional regulator GntR family [Bradyrhizobium elkanii USDA 61]